MPAATKLAPISFSQPTTLDLVVYRGDSGRFRVNVFDGTGNPMDVTAASWDCDVRAKADDAAVILTLPIEPVPGVPSSIDVVLSPADSAQLPPSAVWDLEMTYAGQVTTLLAGKVTTTLDVSRA